MIAGRALYQGTSLLVPRTFLSTAGFSPWYLSRTIDHFLTELFGLAAENAKNLGL
jgi:hypothetical protein